MDKISSWLGKSPGTVEEYTMGSKAKQVFVSSCVYADADIYVLALYTCTSCNVSEADTMYGNRYRQAMITFQQQAAAARVYFCMTPLDLSLIIFLP